MNKILNEISCIINENIKKYLPDVLPEELEDNGSIYYMNGNDGTEFDWFVNDRLCEFMVFYNDKKNLGAAKLMLYNAGDYVLYMYKDKGETLAEKIESSIDVTEEDLLRLAVKLRIEADNKLNWDADIKKFETDSDVTDSEVEEFIKLREYMLPSIERKELMNMFAYVSKKITEEGYKVGFMTRDEMENDRDSGWCFMAGNEEDDYINDYKNIALLSLGQVCTLDPDVWQYINEPVGTELIRISSDKFEPDKKDKPVFVQKRD